MLYDRVHAHTRFRHRTTLFTLHIIKLIDCIECDVTIQISALASVSACGYECVLGRRNQTGNVGCFIDVRIYTHIQFALQDGNFHDFHGNKGVIQYILFKSLGILTNFEPLSSKCSRVLIPFVDKVGGHDMNPYSLGMKMFVI